MIHKKYFANLLVIIFLGTSLLFSQDAITIPENIYTPNQLEMIREQRDMVKKNRETFRNSLRSKNSKLTIRERQSINEIFVRK